MYELSYFNVVRYFRQNDYSADYSDMPRPYFNLLYFLSGSAKFSENNIEITVNKGETLFIPSSSRYKFRLLGESAEYIAFHFGFASLTELSTSEMPIQKLTDRNGKYGEIFKFCHKNFRKESASEFSLLSKFYELLGDIFPRLEKNTTKYFDKTTQKAIDYINACSESDFSVPQLAEHCSMSISGFYNHFKKETGCTPVEYKNRILIHRATGMLLSNKYSSIEEISSLLGFSSSIYFRRIFKAAMGMSPTEYKKSLHPTEASATKKD